MEMHAIEIVEKGSFRFLSQHPILGKIAEHLADGLKDPAIGNRRINVFVGIHRRFGLKLLARGYRIAIQTEQFLAEDGTELWGNPKYKFSLLVRLFFMHRVIDINEANRPRYARLPKFMRDKLVFGPYIFPGIDTLYAPAPQDAPLLFVGILNERRTRIIEELRARGMKVVTQLDEGETVQQGLARSRASLNIHYVEGVYTEYPRLLMSFLSGKPVVSEPLTSDLRPGLDYVTLENAGEPVDLEAIFDTFKHGFARRHVFEDCVRSMLGR